jgi:hypothetical protein
MFRRCGHFATLQAQTQLVLMLGDVIDNVVIDALLGYICSSQMQLFPKFKLAYVCVGIWKTAGNDKRRSWHERPCAKTQGLLSTVGSALCANCKCLG